MTAFNNADAYWIDGNPVDRIIYDGQVIWENDAYGIVEGGEIRIGPLPEQKGYFKTHIFTELAGAQSFVVNQDIDEAWILVVGSGGPTGESATTVPGAGGGGRMFTYLGPITADTFTLAVHPREELSDNANGTGTDLISTLNGIDWNAQAGGSGGDYDAVGSAGGSGGGGSYGTTTRSGGGNSSVGINGTTSPTSNLGNSGQAASASTDFGRGRGGGAKFSGSGGGQGVFNPWRTGEWVEYSSGSVLNPAPDTGNGGYTEVEGESKTGEGGIVMLTYRYAGEGPSRKWYKGSQGDTTATQQLIFCDRDPANGAPFFAMAASSGKVFVSYNGVDWNLAWTAGSTSTIFGAHFDRDLDKLYLMQSTTHYELSADFLTSTSNTPALTSLKRMDTDTTNGIRMMVGSSGRIFKNALSPTVFWDWNTAEQLTIVDSVSLEEWGSTTINDVKTDNNGMWVIVGSGGKMAVSRDSGLTWRIYKEADHGADTLNNYIGYNGNTWVFGASQGTYIHTKDFETWTMGVVESIANEELSLGEISWQEPHQKWFINANTMKSPWTGCFFESPDLVNWESSNTYSSLFPKTIVSGLNRTVASRLSGEVWNTRINENVTLFRSGQPLGTSQLPTLDSSPQLALLDTDESTYWDYETDMNWNNSAGKDLSWLLDVTRFKDNKIDTGRYAFYRSPAVSFTALPDLDTSNITDMYAMFQQCPNFNQSLDNFDTSNVTGMRYMFDAASSFNQPVNHFDVSNVIEMQQMFRNASDFNQDLDNWRPVNAQFIHWMFINCPSFNGSIEGWEIPNVTLMYGMFQGCASFNHPSVSNLTIPEGVSNLKNMFDGANLFNQDISSWSLANVENLEFMFRDALMFDKPLENWNVSAATTMRGMFQNAISFDQDISQWLTQRVTNMSDMFNGASAFRSNLNTWDTSKVTNMSGMFKGASAFASKLTWNTFLVTNMDSMFMDALSFNADLSAWCVPSITTEPVDFNTGAVAWTLPKPLWGYCPGGETIPDLLQTLGYELEDCHIFTANSNAVNLAIPDDTTPIFVAVDGVEKDYATEVKGNVFNGATIHAIFDWDNGINIKQQNWISDISQIGSRAPGGEPEGYVNPTPLASGRIPNQLKSGNYGFYFMESANPEAILNLDVSNITIMQSMFNNAKIFDQPIGDWDVSNVTNMSYIFANTMLEMNAFNQPIGNWDVSNVTDMTGMFRSTPFDQPIGNWNTSNVTSMYDMFRSCSFNQPIGNWDTSNVTSMGSMFIYAVNFNQDISGWDVSKVEDMSQMFADWENPDAPFNSDISGWDVSSVTDMRLMFQGAQGFNQDISGWNTSNVTDMTQMFRQATSFNQDLSLWCVPLITTEPSMFADDTPAWTLPKPVWGTCPGGPGNIFAFAGDGNTSVPSDGTLATSAGLHAPRGVAFDGTNNAVYISSFYHHRVYKVDLATEQVTTLAGTGIASNSGDGGAATSAYLNQPWGLLCHDNKLYIACFGGHVVRVVDLSTNVINTFAGTGTGSHSGDGDVATSAMLQNPAGLAYADGKIYIADMSNNRVRSVDLSNNIIATFAGTGTASNGGDGGQAWAATLNSPRGVAHVDGKVYIADANNHKIRSVDLSSNIIGTFVGTGVGSSTGDGGYASNATLNSPGDVVYDGDGYLYITDTNAHRVRRVNLVSEIIANYAGTGVPSSGGDDGPAMSAQLNMPSALAVGGGYLYIADTESNRVRKVNFEAL